MTHYEMVELLRDKANVSYEEAKGALEAANWDLLDAIVLLERDGKTMNRTTGYSTRPETEQEETPPKKSEFKDGLNRLGRWLLRLIEIGNTNSLVVSRKEEKLFSLPITVFVLLLVFAFPFTAIMLALGLFTGFRYSFSGSLLVNEKINNIMDKAGDIADNVHVELHDDSNDKRD